MYSEEIGEGNFDDYRIETNYSVQRAVVRNDNDDTVSCNCLILIMKGVQQGKTVDIAEGLVVTRPSKIAGPGGHAKGGVSSANESDSVLEDSRRCTVTTKSKVKDDDGCVVQATERKDCE